VIFNIGNQQLYWIKEGSSHLGSRSEVYNAELHAVEEAISALLTTTIPCSSIFICIDNQAAIETLQINRDNYEYARHALKSAAQLRLLCWKISTVCCPSNCGIVGNKHADTLAKLRTSHPIPCQYARITKIWLQAQTRAQLLQRWKQELPLSNPSFTFPTHLHRVGWADTCALWCSFCNRSPSDPHLNKTAEPRPCGQDLHTFHHLLRDCTLLTQHRAKMKLTTSSDIQSLDFLTKPVNWLGLRHLLRATGLGHTTNIRYEKQTTPSQKDEDSDSDSPKPDFGAFEL